MRLKLAAFCKLVKGEVARRQGGSPGRVAVGAIRSKQLNEANRCPGLQVVLKEELERYRRGQADAAEAAALSLATHRLEHLIVQRRERLASKAG